MVGAAGETLNARRGGSGNTPWSLYLSELVGTALLVSVGLSAVILNFGAGSPMLALIPSAGLRRAVTGFLFGSTGALIAVSPVGKTSGAHINPAVTVAFWARGKLRWDHAAGYVIAQLAGAVLGALPLLLWGRLGRSIQFGATVPGTGYGVGLAFAGELATTLGLVVGLFVFVGHRRLRAFTPLLFPFLYAFMVWLEAPVSGTSTNPARTLGPAVIAGVWHAWWIYWIAPLLAAVLVAVANRYTVFRFFEIEVAKLYHFEHDPHGVFRGALVEHSANAHN